MPILSQKQNDMRKDDYVQSILIEKKLYPLETVPVLIKMLGYNCFYIDETKNYYRVRQFNPHMIHKYPRYTDVTSRIYEGVKYVVEY